MREKWKPTQKDMINIQKEMSMIDHGEAYYYSKRIGEFTIDIRILRS